MNKELIILLGSFISFLGIVVSSSIVVYREVKNVHKVINSRMDELLELTRKSAHAAGVLDERERDQKEKPDA